MQYEINIEELIYNDVFFIDVRSPKEYEEDHIKNSINIPLLENDEREIIGTIYKQIGKKEAIDKGYDIVVPKLDYFYNKVKDICLKYEKVVVYCFRGGMRSTSIVDFLISKGMKVYKLSGGYKSYRRYVLDYIDKVDDKFNFIVLHGNTGVGKTELLVNLDKKEIPILDFEQYANNSGSVFGEIFYKKSDSSQKYFESKIFNQLIKYEVLQKYNIFMESESKKIGRCILPNSIWENMKKAKHILITSSIENRVKRCVDDYTKKTFDNDEKLISAISKLKNTIGNKKVNELIEKSKMKDYEYIANFLMLEYYDKLYYHSEKTYDYEFSVSNDYVDIAANFLEKYYSSL